MFLHPHLDDGGDPRLGGRHVRLLPHLEEGLHLESTMVLDGF